MQSTTIITGRIVQDPVEALNVQGDKTVADLTVAVRDYRLSDDAVRYIDVPQWETAAGRAVQYLQKGRWVTVEGLLDAHAYTDTNGQPQIGWTMRRAHIEYGPNPDTAATGDRETIAAGAATGTDDDIPF